jgi:hypothetical protein
MPFSRAPKQRIAKRSQAGAITAVWMHRYGLLKGYMREIEAPTGTDPEQCLDAMMGESLALPMLIAWTEEFTRWETGSALNYSMLVSSLMARYHIVNARVPPSAFVAEWRRAAHADPVEWVHPRFEEVWLATPAQASMSV